MKEVFKFLKELKINNNREWFNENKERYLEAKRTIDLFVSRLIPAIASVEPEVAHLTPADCTYRIYRDTRFSSDKTPYKTHFGIFIAPGGKKSIKAGHYIHIEPGNCFYGGGCWCPPAPLLKAIRQDIYDNIDEYLEITDNPGFKKLFPTVGSDLLKTAPKGFPKDWEYIDLLKPRDYTVIAPLPDSLFTNRNAIERLEKYARTLQPLNDFLNFTIGENA